MRLLFIIDSFGSGGAQRQMVNLAIGLHGRGHEVEFFVYHPGYRHLAEPLEALGIPIHQFQKSGRFSTKAIRALRRLIREGGYDIALSFLDTPNFYAQIAKLGLRRPALVVSERSAYPARLPRRKWLMQQMHRLADHITVNSHHQRERMEREFPWMRRKIRTIYNGVDLREFAPSPLARVEGPRGTPRLLAVGSILPSKNAPVLIRALSIYRDCYGQPPLVRWVGKRVESAQARQAFSEAAQLLDSLKLHDCWEWVGDRKDIPALLREHDALVHPSFFEGLPNVVCEALACGRPVIVSNVLDHPRLVRDNVSGHLFEWNDPQSLAARIKQFYDLSPADRIRMGEEARKYAEERLSLSLFVDSYEHLFSSMLANN